MKKIYVGNLSVSATEDMLRPLFEKYGTVERVNIVTDRDTGQPKDFGFVEMSNHAEAVKAIAALNGSEFDGHTLNVPCLDSCASSARHRSDAAARSSMPGAASSNNSTRPAV